MTDEHGRHATALTTNLAEDLGILALSPGKLGQLLTMFVFLPAGMIQYVLTDKVLLACFLALLASCHG
jgi:hypothetical protein